MAVGYSVEELAKVATDFVVARKGSWGHDDWEAFCAHAVEVGIESNEHNSVALGNLLEALRYFYQLHPGPATAPKKKAAAPRKAAAKKPASKQKMGI